MTIFGCVWLALSLWAFAKFIIEQTAVDNGYDERQKEATQASIAGVLSAVISAIILAIGLPLWAAKVPQSQSMQK